MACKSMLKIGCYDIGLVLQELSLIVDSFIELPNGVAKGRRGGYFTIFDQRIAIVLAINKIKYPDPKDAMAYFDFSMEKVNRLITHEEHQSSYQSRNPDNGEWGGSIRAEDFILSFSGLPELGDEAVMLLIAYRFKWLTEEKIVEIAKLSNNPHVAPLFEKLHQRPIIGL